MDAILDLRLLRETWCHWVARLCSDWVAWGRGDRSNPKQPVPRFLANGSDILAPVAWTWCLPMFQVVLLPTNATNLPRKHSQRNRTSQWKKPQQLDLIPVTFGSVPQQIYDSVIRRLNALQRWKPPLVLCRWMDRFGWDESQPDCSEN